MKFSTLFKNIIRVFVPAKLRSILWESIPKFHAVNTYILRNPEFIQIDAPINERHFIREVRMDDMERLKLAESYRNPKKFEKKIPPRLKSNAWHGLAVLDKNNNEIAYIAWIIDKTIPYFEEFGIKMTEGQFLLKDGFCVPKYRHQGLHTRMEQERINFCVKSGANEIFIQIHDANKKGVSSVLNNGYELYQQNIIILWPIFNMYRSLKGFLKRPFRKVIK